MLPSKVSFSGRNFGAAELELIRETVRDFSNLSLTELSKVSNAGESHPYVLSEPYLNLAAHTAPTMEPHHMPRCQCANSPGSRREIRLTQCVARRM